jgi:hypothetical protein
MGEGRLIRVNKFPGARDAVAFVVAIADKEKAIALIRDKAEPGVEVEDLGRVSEALIAALALGAGEFVSITGLSHIVQQQPQAAAETPSNRAANGTPHV